MMTDCGGWPEERVPPAQRPKLKVSFGEAGTPVCPFCEVSIQVDERWGYRETDKLGKYFLIPTCERCWAALMNLILFQKLDRYRRGDPRKLLRDALHDSGIK